MKKTIAIILGALVIVVSGCNEKKLLDNIEGAWGVKTYLFSNGDQTARFNKEKVDFKWTFNSDKTFTEVWKEIDTVFYDIYVPVTVKDFSGADSIIGFDTVPTFRIEEQQLTRSGNWTLMNSNKYLQLRDTSVRDYRILDHSKDVLRLFKGNEEFLLEPR